MNSYAYNGFIEKIYQENCDFLCKLSYEQKQKLLKLLGKDDNKQR